VAWQWRPINISETANASRVQSPRRKLHHAAGFVGIAECGENFAAHPKIGMVPVGAFFGLGQGELAKVGGGPMGFQISDLRFQIAGYKPLQATNLQSAI
jgi:hypothetical protein